MLAGRTTERARIARLLASAGSRGGQALVLIGEPGIGKTALLDDATHRASGFRVLRSVGIESESALGFHGLADLFRAVQGEIERLPSMHRRALAVAMRLEEAQGPVDRFAVALGALELVGGLAEEQPLLVIVDDAHWLDEPSQEAIAFVARRLQPEAVALLMAIREDEPAEAFAGLPELSIGGLDFDAAGAVLRQAGAGTPSPEVIAAAHRATRGNPLALQELAPSLGRGDETAPGEDRPLAIGKTLQAAFERRLNRLPSPTQRALLLAAAAGGGSLEMLSSGLRGFGCSFTDLLPAEAAGLVEMSQGELRFRHPLLRAAAYQRASPAERRGAHRAVAAAARAAGLEPERSAWHLAQAAVGPDEEVAVEIAEAAAEALKRSGYGSAEHLFGLAANLTPVAESRAGRLFQAANAAQLAGHTSRAIELSDLALGLTGDPALRARVQHLRARIQIWSRDPIDAHSLLLREAASVMEFDRDQAVLMLAEAVAPCFMSGEVGLAVSTARHAHAAARGVSPEVTFMADAALAEALMLHGEGAEARALLDECLPKASHLAPAQVPTALQFLKFGLLVSERYDEGRQLIIAQTEAARAAGAISFLPYLLIVQAEIEYRRARWAEAYALAAEGAHLGAETMQDSTAAYGLVTLARIEAAQGRAADCLAHAETTFSLSEKFGTLSLKTYAGAAIGLLRLGQGRLSEAVAAMRPVAEVTQAQELGDPNVVQWQPDYIEALVRSDQIPEAEAHLAILERQAARTQGRWAAAVAARCRGLLAVARQEEYTTHFEVALARHDSEAVFEIARTQLCLGQALRRSRRRSGARDHLEAALAGFRRLGAEPWERQTVSELAALGGVIPASSRPSLRALTPQETQVALLVAQGMTNREVATRMFISVRTVETHLMRIYSKLEVGSRTQLAVALLHHAGDEAGEAGAVG